MKKQLEQILLEALSAMDTVQDIPTLERSEERRVGKECRL